MNNFTRYALLLAPLVLVACKKTPEAAPPTVVVVGAPAAASAPAPVTAPVEAPAAIDPANMTEEQRKQATRLAALDYSTMEDKYINDPRAQWAETATSNSVEGEESSTYDQSKNMIGAIDDKEWGNKNKDVGLEWVELGYARPVMASEVRLVVVHGVEAISKVELQDTDGQWNTVWSGLSEVKEDERGERTWFVRTFPKTAYKVKAVKYTVANNVMHGSKNFDAAQLVGD